MFQTEALTGLNFYDPYCCLGTLDSTQSTSVAGLVRMGNHVVALSSTVLLLDSG